VARRALWVLGYVDELVRLELFFPIGNAEFTVTKWAGVGCLILERPTLFTSERHPRDQVCRESPSTLGYHEYPFAVNSAGSPAPAIHQSGRF
jgi:hypothetical protein